MVIAPSESIAKILKERGVIIPIEIIPTGVYTDKYAKGRGRAFRDKYRIPQDIFVVGHIGRLAPEKNLEFLSKAVCLFLQKKAESHFVIVGYGSSKEKMNELFIQNNLEDRVHFIGKLKGEELINAYHAMDLFAFSSKSETQGLVLVEAMAAGVPVVALDASGVREVVRDGINGYLLTEQNTGKFASALCKFYNISTNKRESFRIQAQKTSEYFSVNKCVSKLIKIYKMMTKENLTECTRDHSIWEKSIEHIKTEWELLTNLTSAVGDAIQNNSIKR
jgi:glycosyltransferase involved in cell wall biosynthesis